MAQFLAELARADLSPATVRGYRYDLRHFLTASTRSMAKNSNGSASARSSCAAGGETPHLALSVEIRTGTIDRIIEMSNAERGLEALLGRLPHRS
jgi:hypothetical protein